MKPAGEFEALNVSGFVSTTVYRLDAGGDICLLAVVFQSKDAYLANAASPEQDARFQRRERAAMNAATTDSTAFRSSLEQTYQENRSLIAGLRDADMDRRTENPKWRVRRLAAHIAEDDAGALYVAKLLAKGKNAKAPAIVVDLANWWALRKFKRARPADLIPVLDQKHQELMRWLNTVPPLTGSRAARSAAWAAKPSPPSSSKTAPTAKTTPPSSAAPSATAPRRDAPGSAGVSPACHGGKQG